MTSSEPLFNVKNDVEATNNHLVQKVWACFLCSVRGEIVSSQFPRSWKRLLAFRSQLPLTTKEDDSAAEGLKLIMQEALTP